MTQSWQSNPRYALALALAASVAALIPGTPVGAQDVKPTAYGRHLARECTGCHRIDGADNGIPSIIGWPVEVFTATLRYYQTGERSNPVMVSVAGSLDEKQVAALAAYFGSLPKPAPKAARGKK
jgi:cytochrome c553